MSVKIRLNRMGDKKSPYYRVVVTDSRTARGGKCIENLGTYNPLTNPFELKLNEDRVKYWLGVGAIPTETARELLVKAKLLPAKKYRAPLPKKMPPAPKEKKEEAPAEGTPAEGAAPAENTTPAE
ncbi:MAG: 30S ribosomal protein S16 [Clostridia bacterium]|nr:30S ribosomal protein S16 [Clostridia bacterium]